MSTVIQTSLPAIGNPPHDTRRFSIDEFEAVAEVIGDNVELLDGYIVEREDVKPSHVLITGRLKLRLEMVLPPGWFVRKEEPLSIPDASQPRPDLAVVRGGLEDYPDRHPGPADTAMVAEVSDASLAHDQGEKRLIYARAGIPVYWVVDLKARQVEVYSRPAQGGYAEHRALKAGDVLPVVIDGAAVGSLAVADLFA